MEIEILKHEKNELEVKLDNTTVAEILRVYLDKGGVEFAAWRREHPSKPAVMRIESSKNIKKELSDAISEIKKDLGKFAKSVK